MEHECVPSWMTSEEASYEAKYEASNYATPHVQKCLFLKKEKSKHRTFLYTWRCMIGDLIFYLRSSYLIRFLTEMRMNYHKEFAVTAATMALSVARE